MLRSSLQFRALTLLSRQPMQLRSSAHRMASTATPPANSTAVEHDEKNKQFRYLGGHLDYELCKFSSVLTYYIVNNAQLITIN